MNPNDGAPAPEDPTVGLMVRKNLKTGGREFIAPADSALCWELLGYAIERLCLRVLKQELSQGVIPASAADLERPRGLHFYPPRGQG